MLTGDPAPPPLFLPRTFPLAAEAHSTRLLWQWQSGSSQSLASGLLEKRADKASPRLPPLPLTGGAVRGRGQAQDAWLNSQGSHDSNCYEEGSCGVASLPISLAAHTQQCGVLSLNLHGCLCCDKTWGCSTLLLFQQSKCPVSPFHCQSADSQRHRGLSPGGVEATS